MSDDRPLAALIALSVRGTERGAEPVYRAALMNPPTLTTDDGRSPERSRHLVLRIAMVLLVMIMLGAALVATGIVPGKDAVTRVTDEILGSDRGPYDDQLDEWLSEYDPAERQYLKDTTEANFGSISKQYEVGTLEFRRTCRKLSAALDAANAPGVTDRSTAVHEIMDPQLARNDERDRVIALADGSEPLGPGVGAMWEAWHTMTDQVAVGDEARARSFLASSCDRSLGPWVDD